MAKRDKEPLSVKDAFWGTVVIFALSVTAEANDYTTIGGILFFLFLACLFNLIVALFRARAEGSPARARRRSLSPSTQITPAALQTMRTEMVAGQGRLESMRVFDPDAPELVRAWKAKDTTRIEALLREGDEQTRSAWRRATAIANTAGDHIDKARGNLSRLVRQSERQLASYKINPADGRLSRSGIFVAEANFVMPTKRIGPGEFNFRAMPVALNNTLGQAMRGNVSWQGAAVGMVAMVAVAAVAHQIGKSKALRKLKDAEGELSLQAEAVSGDIAMFQTLLTTRMLPQFEALMTLAAAMEGHLSVLAVMPSNAASRNAPPEVAFLLTMTLREAKHYLDMTAGN